MVEGFSGFGVQQGLLQWRRSEIRVFVVEGLKRHRLVAFPVFCIFVRKFSEDESLVVFVLCFLLHFLNKTFKIDFYEFLFLFLYLSFDKYRWICVGHLFVWKSFY